MDSKGNYGGNSKELPENCLPNNGDIARYYYHLCRDTKDFNTLIVRIKDKLKTIWNTCMPDLPLKSDLHIRVKVKRLLEKVRKYNQNKATLSSANNLLCIANNLFDIAACTCKLPVVSCADKNVKCVRVNCDKEHIICECSANCRVPKDVRSYLRSHRPIQFEGNIYTTKG